MHREVEEAEEEEEEEEEGETSQINHASLLPTKQLRLLYSQRQLLHASQHLHCQSLFPLTHHASPI